MKTYLLKLWMVNKERNLFYQHVYIFTYIRPWLSVINIQLQIYYIVLYYHLCMAQLFTPSLFNLLVFFFLISTVLYFLYMFLKDIKHFAIQTRLYSFSLNELLSKSVIEPLVLEKDPTLTMILPVLLDKQLRRHSYLSLLF